MSVLDISSIPDLEGRKQYLVIKDNKIIWIDPTVDDVKACMCMGCKILFPLISVLSDTTKFTFAHERVLIQSCLLHNSHLLSS